MGFTISENPLDSLDAEFIESVPGINISTLMRRFKAPGIDILKLDIEGAEVELLDNSGEWLSKTLVLVAELHDRIVSRCTESFVAATEGRSIIKVGHEKYAAINISGDNHPDNL
ncbi:FkbM family methyltransferase [Pseudoroseomonas wenyumeiae]